MRRRILQQQQQQNPHLFPPGHMVPLNHTGPGGQPLNAAAIAAMSSSLPKKGRAAGQPGTGKVPSSLFSDLVSVSS